MTEDSIREQVRQRYAAAALAVTGRSTADDACCGDDCCGGGGGGLALAEIAPAPAGDDRFGAACYPAEELFELPAAVRDASLGCGNPTAVAALQPGERVLDLGSGGGGDVLLSARRVGPTGRAYGLDMTDEMLDLARRNAVTAGVDNVEFLRGTIEAVPLPGASVDVVISNCVINLSSDKSAVFAEAFRVLRPGGRLGVADVVAADHLTPEQRSERGDWVGCVAGALSHSEYVDGLAAAGFTDITVTVTHQVADGIDSAIIAARRP